MLSFPLTLYTLLKFPLPFSMQMLNSQYCLPDIWEEYTSFSRLILQKDEFLRLVINSIRNDLTSRNEAFHCLALGFVGSGKLQTYNRKHE